MSTSPRAPRSTATAKAVGAHTIKREAASQAELESAFSLSKRELIATVVGMLTSGVCTYFGAVLSATMSLAALALTGSAFLAFMVYFIGVTLAVMAGIAAGARVQRIIVDGSLDRKVSEMRDSVASTFSGLRTRLFA